MELIAFLGEDKETWGQVSALINRGEWDKIIIVKDKNTENAISGNVISVECSKPLVELRDEMKEKLKRETNNEFEVALSLASGNGKEHMALMSALLNIPVGIKIVAYTKKGIEFLT